MIGSIGAFVASRLASGAIDAVERRIIWTAVGGMFFLAALLFLLTSVFAMLEQVTGPMTAAGILGGSCLVLGLIGFSMPRILAWIESKAETDENIVTEFTEGVDDEVEQAVDYFGALEVALSAFMLGFSAARQMRSQRKHSG